MADVSGEDAYVRSLLNASACLITQKPEVSANFLPSKLLPALATGTPVLAICEADSPLGREVTEGGYGAVIHPHNDTLLAETLTLWRENPGLLASFGAKARERSQFFGRKRILEIFERELSTLCAEAPVPSHLESYRNPTTATASSSHPS